MTKCKSCMGTGLFTINEYNTLTGEKGKRILSGDPCKECEGTGVKKVEQQIVKGKIPILPTIGTNVVSTTGRWRIADFYD